MMTCVLYFVKKFYLEKDLLDFACFQKQVNRIVSLDSFINLFI